MLQLQGQRCGKLVALRVIGRRRGIGNIWLCQCDCGRTIEVVAGDFARKTGSHTARCKSCGCERRANSSRRFQKPAQVDIKNWSRENLAWAAGFFEGEGCIQISKAHRSPRLTLVNTDLPVLKRFLAVIGAGSISPIWRASIDRKPIYEWRLSVLASIYPVLVALYHWLGERRRAKAIQLLHLFKQRPALLT